MPVGVVVQGFGAFGVECRGFRGSGFGGFRCCRVLWLRACGIWVSGFKALGGFGLRALRLVSSLTATLTP